MEIKKPASQGARRTRKMERTELTAVESLSLMNLLYAASFIDALMMLSAARRFWHFQEHHLQHFLAH